MIPIPIHIWETVRHLGGARLDLVDGELTLGQQRFMERMQGAQSTQPSAPAQLGREEG